jgi:peptide/nickel transport system permease protein
MRGYLVRRLANGLVVVFIVTLVVFSTVAFLPGDPAETMLGQSAPQGAVEAVRARLGLGESAPTRYVHWLGGVLKGDLGFSAQGGQSVASLVGDALAVTGELMLVSILLAVLISLPLGVVGGLRPRSLGGRLVDFWTFFALSVPQLWLALILVLVFAVHLEVLPATGWTSLVNDPVGNLRGIVLPAVTLAIGLSAPLTRYLRASVNHELEQDYVLTAQMKGVSPVRTIVGHALRNALIPYVTGIGIQFAWLVGGAVIVEVVFALPGMGRLGVEAVFNRDYFVVQGVVLVVAVGVVLVNLLVDLLYVLLDPRVRLGSTAVA